MTTYTKTESLSSLIKKADEVFSKWIRKRDIQLHDRVYCFICGKAVRWQESQNMHFIDRDQMPTRYDEMNCHGGCGECNCLDPDHHERYTRAMVGKYEIIAVGQLIMKSKGLQKFARYELTELIETYKEKLKQIK